MGRGRRKKIVHSDSKMQDCSIKPDLIETYYVDGGQESKRVRIFVEGKEEHLLGYYDYLLKSFVAHQGTETNRTKKIKVSEEQIIGWQYL